MPRDDQGIWNFIFSLFFVGLASFGLYVIYIEEGGLPTSIPLFDLILIMLATFRLTRLFVYDKITEFVRDWFLHKEVLPGDGVELVVVRRKPVRGPKRTVSELLSCPWCFGMWAAFVVTFFYFYTPLAWPVILVFAIAGVASFLQLLSNMVGWRAEGLKKGVEES